MRVAGIRVNAGNLERKGAVLGFEDVSDVAIEGVSIIMFRRFRARRRVWPLLRWILRRHEVMARTSR
jgi:hypothetical protein